MTLNNHDQFPHSNRRRRSLFTLAIALIVQLAAGSVLASDLAAQTKIFIDQQLLPEGMDVEVSVGEPDPRIVLAGCQRSEPFVPSGARLWGRTSLGVRCVEGATWTVFLPAQIKVFAPAPVASRPIARHQVLAADDIRYERIELTQYPVGTFADRTPLDGRIGRLIHELQILQPPGRNGCLQLFGLCGRR